MTRAHLSEKCNILSIRYLQQWNKNGIISWYMYGFNVLYT